MISQLSIWGAVVVVTSWESVASGDVPPGPPAEVVVVVSEAASRVVVVILGFRRCMPRRGGPGQLRRRGG